jgi:cytoskeletal protein RodZ
MSFGEELRRERELRQISLREVAQATKINLRFLEAMERNDFAYLPGGLFNRGFVRAYCQYIGVDSEAMVNAYLLELRSQDGSGPGRGRDTHLLRGPGARVDSEPSHAETDRASSGTRRRRRLILTSLLVLAVVLALAVAGTIVVLRVRGRTTGSPAPTNSGAQTHTQEDPSPVGDRA